MSYHPEYLAYSMFLFAIAFAGILMLGILPQVQKASDFHIKCQNGCLVPQEVSTHDCWYFSGQLLQKGDQTWCYT